MGAGYDITVFNKTVGLRKTVIEDSLFFGRIF